MKVMKWIVVFVLAFLVSWALIFTFSQAPFKEPVQALLLTYKTPPVPIYFYVAGAFGAGLLIGLLVALYYFIVLKAEIAKRGRKLRSLESDLAAASLDIPLQHGAAGSAHGSTSGLAAPRSDTLSGNNHNGVQEPNG